MNPRNFKDDLITSNNPILRKSWENIIREKFGNGVEIFWKDSNDIQKGMGTDLVVITEKGRRYSIELKSRKFGCDSNYIMEIVSHIYDQEEEPRTYLYSKSGWIYTTTAEYVLHGTLNQEKTEVINAIFYSLIPFKTERYKSEFQQYKNLWLPTLFDDKRFQLTLNKLIPVEVIKRDAMEFWKWN